MEIYLIRHTTPEIEKGICYGQSDIPVASGFESEVEEILKNNSLLKSKFIVYSSPLQRCKLLAERLFGSTIYYDKRLMELNFGEWELQPWEDINKSELDSWMKDFVNVSCPNGESYKGLYDRVVEFNQSLHPLINKKIAIITHAGVIRAFLAHYNKVALVDSFKFKVAFGEIIALTGK